MSKFAMYDGQTDHQIEITKQKEVVSINYGGGRKLTLCFIDFGIGEGTIDIMRHDADLKTDTSDGRRMPWWPFIGFCTKQNDENEVLMGQADVREHCTLLTLPYSDLPKETDK